MPTRPRSRCASSSPPDAAREGLNLQAHCSDLFHFDLPWNPGRIEQRNGRIDRKLQPAAQVNCHYFVLPQRTEDRVLEVLVTKTETIKRELGSLSQVIDDSVERRMLSEGIRHRDADALRSEIEAESLDDDRRRATEEELEEARERAQNLESQIEVCQKPAGPIPQVGGFLAGAVPRRHRLLAGVAGRADAGGRNRRRGSPDVDVPAVGAALRHRPELDFDVGLAAGAAQARSEAARVATRRSHSSGGVRGRRTARRGDRASAPWSSGWPRGCCLVSGLRGSSTTTCRGRAWRSRGTRSPV